MSDELKPLKKKHKPTETISHGGKVGNPIGGKNGPNVKKNESTE